MFLTNLKAEIIACMYMLPIRNSRHKPNLYFQIWFSPRFGGKRWWRSENAHASYPGLSFSPPVFSPYKGREERRVQGLDYVGPKTCLSLIQVPAC